MKRTRKMGRRAFLLTLGAAGAAAAGGYYVLSRRPARAPKIVWSGREILGGDPRFDVCVIGSGFAGAVVAGDLARAGFRVVMLESGTAPGGPVDPRLSDLERYEVTGSAEYPLITTRARAAGGTSHLWTGRCERLHPLDFEPNAYTPAGAPWPFRYEAIEPDYARAEETLRVRGGRLSRYSPPRSGGFPIRTPWWKTWGLNRMMREAGYELDESPTSRGEAGDSTLRVHRDLLPGFTSSPSGALVPLLTATRIVIDDKGSVSAVEARTLDGDVKRIRARACVVACGAVESARLLLLSRSERFPNGVGNHADLVGRYFTEHPNLSFDGDVPGMKPILPLEISRSHQVYETFKREGLGSALLMFQRSRRNGERLRIGATVEMRPVPENRVTLSDERKDAFGNQGAHLHFDFTPDDTRTMDRARETIRSIYEKLGAKNVREADRSWSHHHLGTTRMGANPEASVVDPDLRVHGVSNAYVLGSGVFVTGGASHPTLLITALAHRLGRHLGAKLRDPAWAGDVVEAGIRGRSGSRA
jgi:glucose dehydrogenase